MKAIQFSDDMWEMCKARNKADYSHQVILSLEAEKIKNKAISTINLLKDYYEL